jgi:hypothetical protein
MIDGDVDATSTTKLAAIGVVPPLERQGTSDAGIFGATFKLHYSLKLTTDFACLAVVERLCVRDRARTKSERIRWMTNASDLIENAIPLQDWPD